MTPVEVPSEQRPRRLRLGVFDSGLGGLTVLRALIDLLPECETVYFGDTGRFPYGPKPAADVRAYAHEIAEWLIAQDVDLIVVACNSATAAALDSLRTACDIPIVGVIEPGVRAAASATADGHVGVIATVGTVRSGAYQETAGRVAPQLVLSCCATPGFVEFVESGEVDSDQLRVLAERLLRPLLDVEIDTLILGCTHYPLINRCIADVMGPQVVLVSSADETAFEVTRIVADMLGTRGGMPDAQASFDRPPLRRFVTSGDPAVLAHLAGRFLGPEVVTVESHHWT